MRRLVCPMCQAPFETYVIGDAPHRHYFEPCGHTITCEGSWALETRWARAAGTISDTESLIREICGPVVTKPGRKPVPYRHRADF